MGMNIENVAVFIENFTDQFVNFGRGEFSNDVLFAAVAVGANEQNASGFIRFPFVSCKIRFS